MKDLIVEKKIIHIWIGIKSEVHQGQQVRFLKL
mgnify:CR=1 FL=1